MTQISLHIHAVRLAPSSQSLRFIFSARKKPNIALYFEFENELKFYNLKARLVCVFLVVYFETRVKVYVSL